MEIFQKMIKDISDGKNGNTVLWNASKENNSIQYSYSNNMFPTPLGLWPCNQDGDVDEVDAWWRRQSALTVAMIAMVVMAMTFEALDMEFQIQQSSVELQQFWEKQLSACKKSCAKPDHCFTSFGFWGPNSGMLRFRANPPPSSTLVDLNLRFLKKQICSKGARVILAWPCLPKFAGLGPSIHALPKSSRPPPSSARAGIACEKQPQALPGCWFSVHLRHTASSQCTSTCHSARLRNHKILRCSPKSRFAFNIFQQDLCSHWP